MNSNNKYIQLRQKAKQLLTEKRIKKNENYYDDIEKLVEELNIHQIEMEMQNQELQETTQKLETEKSRYKELYMNAPVAYFTLNKTGNIIELNQATADMLKIPIQAFRYTSIFPYLDEQSKNDFNRFFKIVLNSKKTEYGEIIFTDNNKNKVTANLSAIAYFDDSLNENLIRCTVTDLSKIKQFENQLETQQKLINSENRMRILFDKIGTPMLLIKPENGQIEDANPAASEFYGYTIEKLKSMNIAQINQLSESEVKAEIESTRKSGKKYFNFKHKLANGQICDVEVYSTAISFDKTNLLYSIIHDITERKKTETENEQLNIELKTTVEELNTANEELNTTIEELNTVNEELNDKNTQYELSNERLESLLQVSQFPTNSIQELLNFALDEAIKLTESKIGYIYFYNEKNRQFILNSWSKGVMKECKVVEPQTVYDLDKTGIWGEAVRQRKTILVNDFKADNPLKKGTPEGHVELKKFLTIPVIIDDKIVAVTAVANKEKDYNEADIRQLTLLMDSVWKISERLLLIKDLKTAKKQTEQLNIELKTTVEELNTANEELNSTNEELYTVNEELNNVNNTISEEREQFLSILDSIPELIYVSDLHSSEILFTNKKLKEIIGRNITGEKCYKAIQNKTESCEFCTNKYIKTTNKPYFWEYYNPVIDRHFYIMDRKIRWADNKEVRFELAIDITDRKKAEEENKKLSIAVEQNPISIVITNLNGDIEYVNPTFTRLTGYTKEDVIGSNPRVLKSGKTSPEIFTDLWKTITAGKTWSGQFINKTKKGDEFIEKATISPIFNENGKKINYIAIKEDITQKVKIENQIKRNEEIFRIAFDSANIGIMNVSKSGEILYANEECTNIFGYSKKELKTKTVNEIAVPEDKNVSTRFIKTALKDNTHEKAVFEKRYFHKNGNIITCEISSVLLHDTNNKPLYFISHIKDITQQKQAKEKLRKSEENLKSIIENSSNVFYKHDVNHKLTFLSPQIKDFLGYEPQEAKQAWTELATDNPINKTAYDITVKAIESGEKQDVYDAELQHKDGSKIWVEIREAPIVKNGKTVEIVGSLTDVTEKRKFEQILKASEEKYRLITENASDVIWILNITKEKFTYISPSVYALRGYTPEEAMQQDINQSLTPESAKKVMESITEILPQFLTNPTEESKRIHRHELQQTCKDGSIIWIETTTRYQFNSNNEIEVIGISRNIDERKKHQEYLANRLRYEENLVEFSNTLFLNENNVINKSLFYLLQAANCSRVYIFENFTDNENQLSTAQTHEACAKGIEPQIDNPELQHLVYKKDGFERWQNELSKNKIISGIVSGFPENERAILEPQGIKSIIVIPIWVNHKWFGFIGFDETRSEKNWNIEDIDLLRTASEILGLYLQNNKAKQQIIEQNQMLTKQENRLKDALETKEVLLKEVHHRVKNNLQTISSLLYQQQTLSKDPKIADALRDSMNRVSTMALIHQFIYKSPDLKNINMKNYINDLVGKLANTYNQSRKGIKINTEIEEIYFDIEKTIPVALIINEVLSNTFKYAFDEKENGIVDVILTKVDNEKNKLVISDNGIGFPQDFIPEKSKSLGMYLIKNFAKRQLKGKLQIKSNLNEGVKYEIEF